jgi:hypothetical protein
MFRKSQFLNITYFNGINVVLDGAGRLNLIFVLFESLHDVKAFKNVDEIVDSTPLNAHLLNAVINIDDLTLRWTVNFGAKNPQEPPTIFTQRFLLFLFCCS